MKELVQALVDALEKDDSKITFYRLSWSPRGGMYEYVERDPEPVKRKPPLATDAESDGGSFW